LKNNNIKYIIGMRVMGGEYEKEINDICGSSDDVSDAYWI